MIQYWNYLREYKNQKKIVLNSIDKVFQSGTLLFGNELKKFEKNFCKFNKSKMIFSLPTYPSIKNNEIENIIKNINKILLKI